MSIKIQCPACSGTGIIKPDSEKPEFDYTCEPCGGVGTIEFGEITELVGVYHTYKIIEATDDAEYSALSDASKIIYRMILSCGFVDLSSGTSVRTKLLAMFGPGTTTRTNLITLVGE